MAGKSVQEGIDLAEFAPESPVFTAALLKVASRCNLDCDYCYVYKHADQSWRAQPKFMSQATIEIFAQRLLEYLQLQNLNEFSVTFHGGEPLLFGGQRLSESARMIRKIAGPDRSLSFSLQTNGTLLTDELITQLELAEIEVSISLDGPRHVNDRHRPDHAGKSTFESTFEAIRLLQRRKSKIFTGVIAVIDPAIPPRELFEFFAALQLPRLDLLLPDATYDRLPPGREKNPSLFIDWLQEAFRLWFREYSQLPVRWFDTLLASRLGIPAATDAMGFGSVSLIVIDTDGTYTDHDVFKITENGRASLGHNLTESSFQDISQHPSIREHCFRLTLMGLPKICQTCPVVDACGAGSVMHRWHPLHRLNAPSVYCPELFNVLETTTHELRETLAQSLLATPRQIVAIDSGSHFLDECVRWRSSTEHRADEAALRLGINRVAGDSAAAVILTDRFGDRRSKLDVPVDADRLVWLDAISLQSTDPRLVAPFLQTIRVLPRRSEQVQHGIDTLREVEQFLSQFDRALPRAFAAMISDIIFVESTVMSEEHIFSFSDDSAPNVLYVSPFVGKTPLGPDDLGDSLLHEFLHQVLYHMDRDESMLHDHVYPRFPAPWRDGLRPAGGFFHGTFVFSTLSQYWAALARSKDLGVNLDKAKENSDRFTAQAEYGIKSLRQFALLTKRGEALLDQLATSLGMQEGRMVAPYFRAYSNAQ